jgi:hypothetical protein
MYIDIRKEDIFTVDPTFAMSLGGMKFASGKDDICIASSFLNAVSANAVRADFYIPAKRIEAGLCCCSCNAVSLFSFTENFESIIRTLNLTVCSVVKCCRRTVRQKVCRVIERAKNVVPPTAPRFLRL